MDFDDVVLRRHSSRMFLPDKPVPQELLQEALTLAMRAPSNSSVQPWRVFLTSGARRERLGAALAKQVRTTPPPNLGLPDSHSHLRRELGALLYGAMGVARDDSEGRWTAQLRNWDFFHAPVAGIVCMHPLPRWRRRAVSPDHASRGAPPARDHPVARRRREVHPRRHPAHGTHLVHRRLAAMDGSPRGTSRRRAARRRRYPPC